MKTRNSTPLRTLLGLCVLALAIPCAVKGQSPVPNIPPPPVPLSGQELPPPPPGMPPPAPPASHMAPAPPQSPFAPPPQTSPFAPGPASGPAHPAGRPRLFRRLRGGSGEGERPRLRDRFRALFSS